MRSEKSLLRDARKLDEAALTELYDSYSNGIFRYALRSLGDEGLAEECVAETFSRFIQSLSRGGGPKQYIKAYLYRIAHNWITDQYRRAPKETVELKAEFLPDGNLLPTEAFDAEMESARVHSALGKLTPEQRQVIILRYLEDWKIDEIAKVMQKEPGAVKSLRHRGINSLRRILNADDKVADE